VTDPGLPSSPDTPDGPSGAPSGGASIEAASSSPPGALATSEGPSSESPLPPPVPAPRNPWAGETPAPWRESAPVAAFLGWLLPGLGHLWLRRPGKALHYFAVVGGAWALGFWLSGGLAISFDRHPVWLAAQGWLAGPTVAAAWWSEGVPVVRRVPLLEVGQLYVAVASLLNLVAISDAVGIAESISERRRRRRGAGGFAPEPEGSLFLPPALVAARPVDAVADEWPPAGALPQDPGAPR
jgi:hypothetical protein